MATDLPLFEGAEAVRQKLGQEHEPNVPRHSSFPWHYPLLSQAKLMEEARKAFGGDEGKVSELGMMLKNYCDGDMSPGFYLGFLEDPFGEADLNRYFICYSIIE